MFFFLAPSINLPDDDASNAPAPHKKNSIDVKEPVPILGAPQPVYEEEGPRRAPKSSLTPEDPNLNKSGTRKISQPSIKLDIIDESGGMFAFLRFLLNRKLTL